MRPTKGAHGPGSETACAFRAHVNSVSLKLISLCQEIIVRKHSFLILSSRLTSLSLVGNSSIRATDMPEEFQHCIVGELACNWESAPRLHLPVLPTMPAIKGPLGGSRLLCKALCTLLTGRRPAHLPFQTALNSTYPFCVSPDLPFLFPRNHQLRCFSSV